MFQKWFQSKCIRLIALSLLLGCARVEVVHETSGPEEPAMHETKVEPKVEPKIEPKVEQKTSEKVVEKKEEKAQIKPVEKDLVDPTSLDPIVLESSLLEKVQKKYAEAKMISADFIQIKNIKAMGLKKKSTGKLSIRRPEAFRWETQEPDKNLMVSDGDKFWFYTPPFDEGERGQVVIRKSSEINTRLASSLLAGDWSDEKTIEKVIQKGEKVFELVPRNGISGDVVKITIEVNPAKALIQRVILSHKNGNRTEVALQNISIRTENVSPELFEFKIPPNTDVLKNGER